VFFFWACSGAITDKARRVISSLRIDASLRLDLYSGCEVAFRGD
jgi:hypothetical protein